MDNGFPSEVKAAGWIATTDDMTGLDGRWMNEDVHNLVEI